jgi:histidine triad (HIT) family protein
MAVLSIMRSIFIRNGFLRQAALLFQSQKVRRLLSWFITHMSFAFPAHRLLDTETLLAFHHPQPSYPLHILLVPKKPLQSLMDIAPNDKQFLIDLIESVKILVMQFDLERRGYRLITNGGPNQDFPYLHFHLVSIELE